MWFKKKPKNRRLGREHVLDVKLRSSQVREARVRLAAVGIGAAFASVLGIYILWVAADWGLRTLVYENEAFAIQRIEVQTDGVMAVDQLRRWMGVKSGHNLLALDHVRVRRDLEMIPRVRFASVEKVLPGTLRVRVVEREPVAFLNVPRPKPGGGFELARFELDSEGWVMLPLELNHRSAPPAPWEDQLPVICGLNANEIQTARRLEHAQVQAAVELILAFDQSSMAGLVDLKRIDVSEPEVLLVTTGQGSEVTFGLVDIEQQLRRWREVYEQGLRVGKVIATLDLAVTNNVPARWLEASSVPPSSPNLPKNLRTRKKHV
jgi:cell division septal protein FtsQ